MRLGLIVSILLLALFAPHARAQETAPAVRPPNVVLIFADDMGYGDLGCYGGKNPTPNLDRMAQQGVRFTDFYVAQPVCTASRAALLTGCYSNRVGLLGALGPKAQIGINPNETTLAEVFKSRGYATAIFGKWHLGHLPQFLPTRHGFDEYYGLPYSNDMWPKHPTMKFPDLPLIERDQTLELNPDQTKLTTSLTERAVDFIGRKKDESFFLYVPHPMPHVPLFVSEKHAGKSGRGLYGDVIAEVDWAVGQILDALKRHGLDERTLVIFTSDNGPWLSYGNHAGSAGPLREGKGTTFEGGVRVPCLMRWPNQIAPGGVCRMPAATIDLLPTLAKLIGAEAQPRERVIDGRDIWPLIQGDPAATSPREALFFYWNQELQAVRSGKWKLQLPHGYPRPDPPGSGGQPGPAETMRIELSLYDLETDPGESKNVAADHPDVVARLQALAESCRDDLGDAATKRQGKNVRPPGKVSGSTTVQSGVREKLPSNGIERRGE
ncbi:MAG: sulfatase [Planctomycetota bacterium]|nr:sulfatase [Planctomycetota bacterium]